MKNCKIIPNKGCYLSGLNKSFYDIALDLICNQTAIFGLDNTVKMYTLLNGKIKSSELHPQKEYMKVIAKFEMPKEANTTICFIMKLIKEYQIMGNRKYACNSTFFYE